MDLKINSQIQLALSMYVCVSIYSNIKLKLLFRDIFTIPVNRFPSPRLEAMEKYKILTENIHNCVLSNFK